MKKKIEKTIYLTCFVLLAWVAMSYMNTITHNMSDCRYAEWNLLTIMSGETAEARTAAVPKATKHYSNSNVVLLAKLIEAENGSAQNDETLWLTGAVVMKRVKSKAYPNSIRGVIYQRGQYATAAKLDSVNPSTRALEIANDLLGVGCKELPDNLVFQAMFPQGREVYKKIDGEYFCLA